MAEDEKAEDTAAVVTEEAEETAEAPKVEKSAKFGLKDAAKALGMKRADILGFNEHTLVVVTSAGGKYQFGKNGKSLRHLAGPKPKTDLKVEAFDARLRSVFAGTAAEINAAVHEDNQTSLLAKKAALEAQLAEVDEKLEA
jgi:hypothetical protein